MLQVVKESFKLLNSVQKNEGTPEKGHGDESRLYTNYIIYNKLYTHGHVYFCFVSAEQSDDVDGDIKTVLEALKV